MPNQQLVNDQQSVVAPEQVPLPEQRSKKSFVAALMVIIVILIVFGVGYASWQLFMPRFARVDQSLSNQQATAESAKPGDADGDGLLDTQEKELGTDAHNKDTDGDGLLDGEEATRYKTDPIEKDTDKDGLTDKDELFIWRSGPLEQDSDGDTYKDGDEVKKGYDPNGTGILPQGYAY